MGTRKTKKTGRRLAGGQVGEVEETRYQLVGGGIQISECTEEALSRARTHLAKTESPPKPGTRREQVLVEKHLRAQVEELTAKIAVLEKEIADLKKENRKLRKAATRGSRASTRR